MGIFLRVLTSITINDPFYISIVPSFFPYPPCHLIFFVLLLVSLATKGYKNYDFIIIIFILKSYLQTWNVEFVFQS